MMNLTKCLTAFPRISLAVILPVIVFAGQAAAADDITARAVKLYEKNHYEDAARLLQPELAAMDDSRRAAASLALGMIYLGSAQLYRALHQSALAIELDYLTQLSKQKEEAASRYVDFYLGQVLIEAGKPVAGIRHLRRFAGRVDAKSSAKAHANIELGIAYSSQKQPGEARKLWSGLDLQQPEIKAALAGAYAITAMPQNNPVAMADAAMNAAKEQRYIPSARMLKNLLRAYSRGGAPEKALELLNTFEFRGASYVESLGPSKSISFYDLSVLDDMASTHLYAAVSYFQKAARDEKLSNTVNYYLAEAYLLQGSSALSLRAGEIFVSQQKIPSQYRDLARVHEASAYYLAGKQEQAESIWESLAEKSAQAPALIAAVIDACGKTKSNCIKLEKLAVPILNQGEGKKFFALNSALGKYYLLRKDYADAVLYMEAGRDKSNKNKIEANDPRMLSSLAEAYYRNKKYSETLEIYFELAKQFPVVRQLQEAMQGIYAMEQQSAGDVKIF